MPSSRNYSEALENPVADATAEAVWMQLRILIHIPTGPLLVFEVDSAHGPAVRELVIQAAAIDEISAAAARCVELEIHVANAEQELTVWRVLTPCMDRHTGTDEVIVLMDIDELVEAQPACFRFNLHPA